MKTTRLLSTGPATARHAAVGVPVTAGADDMNARTIAGKPPLPSYSAFWYSDHFTRSPGGRLFSTRAFGATE